MSVQNQAELMAHRDEPVAAPGRGDRENGFSRFGRLTKIAFTHGPLYAKALARMTSTADFDPEDNWRYWTESNPLLERILRLYPGRNRRQRLLDRMLSQGHAEGIEFHYDVSNDFYRLFLDRDYLFYTCARFLAADETLEQAQINKADFLIGLLEPKAHHRILDLGFGWGGMLRRISETTGTRDGLQGFTLSKEQLAYVKELGFDVELEDFIEYEYTPESFDRVISVGSIEHVRPSELPSFYQKIFQALTPGGRMVNQFFSLDHDPLPYSMILSQLFFPGSSLAMHDLHVDAATKAGFRIETDQTDSYKRTLRAWYDNLVSNREEAIATAGISIYNEYLTFFPIAWRFFDVGESTLHRMLLIKPQ